MLQISDVMRVIVSGENMLIYLISVRFGRMFFSEFSLISFLIWNNLSAYLRQKMDIMRYGFTVKNHQLFQFCWYIVDRFYLLVRLFDLEHYLQCNFADLDQVFLVVFWELLKDYFTNILFSTGWRMSRRWTLLFILVQGFSSRIYVLLQGPNCLEYGWCRLSLSSIFLPNSKANNLQKM